LGQHLLTDFKGVGGRLDGDVDATHAEQESSGHATADGLYPREPYLSAELAIGRAVLIFWYVDIPYTPNDRQLSVGQRESLDDRLLVVD
jgi:hypothetical protein